MPNPSIEVQVQLSGGELGGRVIAEVRQRLQNLTPAVARFPAEIRATVAEEFAQQAWFSPHGVVPWKPRQSFGNRQPGGQLTMQNSGAYFGALMGGPGSIESVSADRCVIGVSGERFPFAAALRGGARNEVSPAPVFIRPVAKSKSTRARWAAQWSMFWLLGLRFGVWLKDETLRRGLRLVPRPHMTDSPQLRARLGAVLRDYVLGRAA